jgi:dTDP-4-dehydrorhamnose reductase
MKLLITGASSYLGSRIYYDLKDKFEPIGTYYQNKLSASFIYLDLTKKEEIEKLVKKSKPNVIIHVANYPSPRPAQDNEKGYVQLNLEATKYLIEAADNIGTKLIFISSFAAMNPDNIYGKLKLESEKLVEKTKAGYLILRPSLIIGFSPNTTNDRPFNRILKCLDEGKKAEFDTSWKFQPTYVGHISQVIKKSIEKNVWNKTIPIVIGELVTQYQIARDILEAFDIKVYPIDKGYNIPSKKVDLSILDQFGLKPKNYGEMIKTIIDEIKDREKFRL